MYYNQFSNCFYYYILYLISCLAACRETPARAYGSRGNYDTDQWVDTLRRGRVLFRHVERSIQDRQDYPEHAEYACGCVRGNDGVDCGMYI